MPAEPGRRRGRRDNGLDAAAFVPLADVDPRVGEHLLDVLRLAEIPAYLEPSSDVEPYTRAVAIPSPPTDRLWVDRAQRTAAKDIVEAEAEASGLRRGPTPRRAMPPRPGDDRPSSGLSDRAEERVWEEIVASFGTETNPIVPPWPVQEDVDPVPPGPTAPPAGSDPAGWFKSDPKRSADPTAPAAPDRRRSGDRDPDGSIGPRREPARPPGGGPAPGPGAAESGSDVDGARGGSGNSAPGDVDRSPPGPPAPDTGGGRPEDAITDAIPPVRTAAPSETAAPSDAVSGPNVGVSRGTAAGVDSGAAFAAGAGRAVSPSVGADRSDSHHSGTDYADPSRTDPSRTDPSRADQGQPDRRRLDAAPTDPDQPAVAGDLRWPELAGWDPLPDADTLWPAGSAAGAEPDDEGHFVPPPPPPMPRPSRQTVLGLCLVALGTVLFAAPGLIGLDWSTGLTFGVLGVLTGAGILVLRLRESRSDDDPDDGAVV